jgi:hypothetical protein
MTVPVMHCKEPPLVIMREPSTSAKGKHVATPMVIQIFTCAIHDDDQTMQHGQTVLPITVQMFNLAVQSE